MSKQELAQRFIKWRRIQRKNYNYLRNYKISLKQVSDLKAAQNFKCAICKMDFENSKKTHVDHNHFTMKIRGLLCSRCNLGLGMFKDEISNLENAVKYLQENDG